MISGKDKDMKTVLSKIFVLVLFAFSSALFRAGAQNNDEPVFEDEQSEFTGPKWQMPDEMIDQILIHLQQNDPNAAERLTKLRTENPEQFKTEFRNTMRQQWEKMGQKGWQQWQKMSHGENFGHPGWPNPQGKNNPHWQKMEQMRQKHEEYIQWLKDNYPEDANQLEEIRQKSPELYMRKMMQSVRKYGRIAEAAKDNPELAEVLKEDVVLKENRDAILKKMRTADDKQKEALTKELTKITSEQFDLIIKRKQIQHQQLLKRLDQLKEEIKTSEAQVEKWKALKDDKVNERVGELVNRTEKFQWD